jgi:hypothetical protein
MPATSDQLTVARSWIGTSEEDATFHERYDRHAAAEPGQAPHVSLSLAIEESLRAQLAAMILDQPSQISTGGDSFGYGDNIRALQKHIENFVAQGGIPDPDLVDSITGPSVARVHRTDLR